MSVGTDTRDRDSGTPSSSGPTGEGATVTGVRVPGDAPIVADAVATPRERLVPGVRLGRYSIMEEIGRGAMGVVFAAFDPALDRRVALKVVTGSGDTKRDARLLREAQAMARLSHRNVVAVHDVGEVPLPGGSVADPEMVVFIAMEFVRGGTLRTWLRPHRAWAEIVAMFVACARGLAAAHRAGLVHADFKPDNVLVDDESTPRVADFGLVALQDEAPDRDAAPLDASDAEAIGLEATAEVMPGILTRSRAVLGTPAYMASEVFAGRRADAASDQFALCVALFEALYGLRPFSGATLEALGRAVHQGVPREVEDDRGVPSTVRRIVLRGLAVDAAQRWPSMTALGDALAATLAPRRRTTTWILAGGALVVGALGWVALQRPPPEAASPCAGSEDAIAGVWNDERRAALERSIAASGRSYASTITRTLGTVLDRRVAAWIEQHHDACAATHIRGEQSERLLDQRMVCLQRRRSELDRWLAEIVDGDVAAIDRAVAGLEGLPRAEICGDTARLGGEPLPPEEPRQRAMFDDLERRMAEIDALGAVGRFVPALAAAETLVPEAATLAYAPLHAEALLQRATLRREAGGADAAPKIAEDAFAALLLARRHGVEVLAVRANFVLAYDQIRRADAPRGRDYVAIARAGIERLGGEPALSRIAARYDGFLSRVLGEYDAALAAHTLEIEFASANEPDSLAVASALMSVADSQLLLGDLVAAEARYEEALALQRRLVGEGHPAVARTLNNLAQLHIRAKRYDRAIYLLERALAIHLMTSGRESEATADTIANLGIARGEQGDAAGWIAALEEVLELRKRLVAPGHDKLVIAHNDLGNAYFAADRLDDAHAQYEAALVELDRSLGRDHALAAHPSTGLAYVARSRGDLETAALRHRDALAVRERIFGAAHVDLLENLVPIAELESQLGHIDRAHAARDRAVALLEQLSERDPDAAARIARLRALP